MFVVVVVWHEEATVSEVALDGLVCATAVVVVVPSINHHNAVARIDVDGAHVRADVSWIRKADGGAGVGVCGCCSRGGAVGA